jgi:hypothetical protein
VGYVLLKSDQLRLSCDFESSRSVKFTCTSLHKGYQCTLRPAWARRRPLISDYSHYAFLRGLGLHCKECGKRSMLTAVQGCIRDMAYLSPGMYSTCLAGSEMFVTFASDTVSAENCPQTAPITWHSSMSANGVCEFCSPSAPQIVTNGQTLQQGCTYSIPPCLGSNICLATIIHGSKSSGTEPHSERSARCCPYGPWLYSWSKGPDPVRRHPLRPHFARRQQDDMGRISAG